MRLLFKGGTVVTGKGPRRADILVEGEKILDVCRDIPAIGAQVVDVTGMLYRCPHPFRSGRVQHHHGG